METHSKNSRNIREYRRLRAMELYEQGWRPIRIAEALGVTRGAVSQWMKAYREKGIEALRYRKVSKKPARLSQEQKTELVAMLQQGPERFGYVGHVWTQARVGELIKRKFGVSYSVDHVGRILKGCGWTYQKPVSRASQRKEETIRQWCHEYWPEVKKNAEDESRKIVFVDESGFYLLPFTGKTYAPKRKTPILHNKLSREHLSVIGGISRDGRLYIQIRESSFKGCDVVEYLRHLLKHIPGKILVVWDGSPIHRNKDVKKFLTEEDSKRMRLECLPGYSPDLNPAEGIWQYLKCVCLKNICCLNLRHLKKELKRAISIFRSRKHIIESCFSRVKYV